ncbi:LytR/AlgR family response regulator transcription factor [Pseudobacteroides cellulosolvens]|uniref:Stage 0 sporulation protein A homolog n=1 Tax=Pseudobacteroides cellulosolvens ATCC 35603 = DSM 2933 TaxID=398512 RepID=A0A0L6JHL9_9FIRM|nr:LytTR family DNA-binding domain-containing protein [Pseudobacteroides cellulosolvens]KNY25356.1 two component transcriptional regulator, LytTR family [Pseudobacteroides cellulosolvens ATCC 35603 = DSM 2933]
MVKVILVDDERFALDELEFLLKKHQGIEIAATFDDPVTALEEAKNIKFDAAFLDIDMPVINGLNVARELIELHSNIKIIFVTAYDDYAVKAFDLNAIDYILKPVDRDRLDRAVERLLSFNIKNTSKNSSIIDKLNRIDQNLKQDSERFPAYDDEDINLIKISDIYYFEAQLGKTIIVSTSGKFKTKEMMDNLEAKLGTMGFFRCHRSYLVNLRYVTKISPMFNNNFILNLEDVTFDIPVSRLRIKDLKAVLGIK